MWVGNARDVDAMMLDRGLEALQPEEIGLGTAVNTVGILGQSSPTRVILEGPSTGFRMVSLAP